MARVLLRAGHAMSAPDLAETIRAEQRYVGADGQPTARQIHARVGNYPDLFVRVDGGIWVTQRPSGLQTDQVGPSSAKDPAPNRSALDPRTEWHWEGRVQDAFAAHLRDEGWSIARMADTASRERGIDIVAEREGRRMLVEVKGFPSRFYVRGPRTGQTKRTSPNLQARHWLAHGFHASAVARSRNPEADVVLVLPDVPRYQDLLSGISLALQRLEIGVYLVGSDGGVLPWCDSAGPTGLRRGG